MKLERGIITSFSAVEGYGWVTVGELELVIMDDDSRAFELVDGRPALSEASSGRLLERNDQVMCEVDHGRIESVVRWGFADEYDQLVQSVGEPSEFQGGRESGGVGPGTVVF